MEEKMIEQMAKQYELYKVDQMRRLNTLILYLTKLPNVGKFTVNLIYQENEEFTLFIVNAIADVNHSYFDRKYEAYGTVNGEYRTKTFMESELADLRYDEENKEITIKLDVI